MFFGTTFDASVNGIHAVSRCVSAAVSTTNTAHTHTAYTNICAQPAHASSARTHGARRVEYIDSVLPCRRYAHQIRPHSNSNSICLNMRCSHTNARAEQSSEAAFGCPSTSGVTPVGCVLAISWANRRHRVDVDTDHVNAVHAFGRAMMVGWLHAHECVFHTKSIHTAANSSHNSEALMCRHYCYYSGNGGFQEVNLYCIVPCTYFSWD